MTFKVGKLLVQAYSESPKEAAGGNSLPPHVQEGRGIPVVTLRPGVRNDADSVSNTRLGGGVASVWSQSASLYNS